MITAYDYSLRDYQIDLRDRIHKEFEGGCTRLLLQLATGGGKTVLFGHIAKDFASQSKRTLVIAHRAELVYQTADKLAAICNCQVGIIKSGEPWIKSAPIQVASIQTLINRDRLDNIGLLVVDEAHHSSAKTYKKIINTYPDARLLGVTATPKRLDNQGFDSLFEVLIQGMPIRKLIERGYLSQYRYFADANPMKTGRIAFGEYIKCEIVKLNSVSVLSANLIESYRHYLKGKQCLTFAINVSHSKAIAERYNEAGIRACHLDGKTSKSERDWIIERFRCQDIQVLCNVNIVSEGFDVPYLDAVQIARPTKSLTFYLQMVGRSLRPAPGKIAYILDHTNNWQLHGLPCRDRTWSLSANTQQQEQELVRDSETGEIEAIEQSAIEENEGKLREIYGQNLKRWQKIWEDLLFTKMMNGYQKQWLHDRLIELKPPIEIWQKYVRYEKR